MRILKTYIGTKVIKAEPMERSPETVGKSEPGYKVVYPDGYESWSPKETFENAYRELSENELLFIERR